MFWVFDKVFGSALERYLNAQYQDGGVFYG